MDSAATALPGSVSVNSSTRLLSSLMGRSLGLSCIFKTVQSSFFDAHAFQPGAGKPAQAVKNFDTKIFRGRNGFAKFRDFFVQVLVVKRFDNFAFDKRVQVAQIRDHSRGLIDWAGACYFQNVVVAM